MRTKTKDIRFRKSHKSLDAIDAKILQALGTIGPRNVHEIARELGMPTETVWYRIKRLHSRFSMFVQGNVYHTNVGLRKLIVFAEAFPGYEDVLYEGAKSNDYWIYLSQCLGGPITCLGVYAIPDEHAEDFEKFVLRLEELGIAKSTQTYWSTSFQTVNLTLSWFNPNSSHWELAWDKWIEEVRNQDCTQELPYTLLDPEEYDQKADYIDIFILKELEKNAAIRFSDLAKMLGTSIQNVRYHFENHIVKRKMLEGWQVLIPHFGKEGVETSFFLFDFENQKNLRRFASSLLNKPFIRTVGKVFGDSKLFVQVYLPRKEFRPFLEALSKIVKSGLLKSYKYVIQDLTKRQRQTISFEFFENKKWVYAHEDYLKRAEEIANRFGLERTRF